MSLVRTSIRTAIVLAALTPTLASAASYDSELAWKGRNSRGGTTNGNIGTVQQPLQEPPPPLPAQLGSSGVLTRLGETDSFGNARWGGGYRLAFVSSYARSPEQRLLRAEGGLETWGRVLGNRFDAVEVETRATATDNTTGADTVRVDYSVYVFGQRVLAKTINSDRLTTTTLFEKTQRVTPEYTQVFFVGFVPVTVKAGANAREDLKLTGTLGPQSIDATLTPGARVYVYADAFAGVPGVLGAGVEGALTLLRAGVPFSSRLSWSSVAHLPTPTQFCSSPVLVASFGTDLVLGTLDGWLDAYAELFFTKPSVRIAEWKGPELVHRLFSVSGSARGAMECIARPPIRPVLADLGAVPR